MSEFVTLAAEGGYQVFNLRGGEWAWLILSAATAILAIMAAGVARMAQCLAGALRRQRKMRTSAG